jgi:RNA polymerase sigma-70 factor (ECF subfamily)
MPEGTMQIAARFGTLSQRAQDEGDDDAALVRLAHRRPAAFEPLYLRYRDRVLAYCAYRLTDPAEAEDAASAVFLKALHGLSGFRDRDGSFRTWLFRIAHNEVADRHRRCARRPETSLDLAAGLTDPGASPEEEAIAADAASRLRALLGTLPPREREVLELRLADLSTAEIAAVLSVREQSVWTAQSRGLARVRDALKGSADA